jgi:hypothetical protein
MVFEVFVPLSFGEGLGVRPSKAFWPHPKSLSEGEGLLFTVNYLKSLLL